MSVCPELKGNGTLGQFLSHIAWMDKAIDKLLSKRSKNVVFFVVFFMAEAGYLTNVSWGTNGDNTDDTVRLF